MSGLRVSEEIKKLIRDGVPKGKRSQVLFKVLRALVKAGHDDATIRAVLLDPANGLSEKPREKGATWLGQDIARAREKPDAKPDDDTAKAPSYVSLTLAELLDLPTPEWLIDEVLPAGSLVVLCGPWKLGKSFVALDMAAALAARAQWQGRDVQGGDVIYVSAEGTQKKRMQAWIKENGIEPERLLVWPKPVSLRDGGELGKFIQEVRARGWGNPVLIVCDTLSRCFGGGRENDQGDMAQFVEGTDREKAEFPGVTQLIIHHPGKDESRGPRGSSVLPAAIDTQMVLKGNRFDKPRKAEAEGADYVASFDLSCEFQKDDEPFEPIKLALRLVDLGYKDTKGRPVKSCVVEEPAPALHSFGVENPLRGSTFHP